MCKRNKEKRYSYYMNMKTWCGDIIIDAHYEHKYDGITSCLAKTIYLEGEGEYRIKASHFLCIVRISVSIALLEMFFTSYIYK